MAQFVPSYPYALSAQSNLPIELKVEELPKPSVGESLQITVERNDKKVTETMVRLSPQVEFELETVGDYAPHSIEYQAADHMLLIEWGEEEPNEITFAAKIAELGNIEIASSYVLDGSLYKSNDIVVGVEEEDVEIPSGEENEMETPREENEDDGSEEPVIEEPVEETLEEEEESKAEEPVEEEEADSDLETEVIPENELEEESSIEADAEEKPEEEQEADSDLETENVPENGLEESQAKEESSIAELQVDDDYHLVGSGSEFRAALEDANVKKIRIANNFNVTLRSNDLAGNKIIDGNGKTVNFYGYKIRLGANHLRVENLKIEAVQSNIPSSATFTSDHPDAVLVLKDVSFPKVEYAQVAKMPQGTIHVEGTVEFEIHGPFEIFEAKNIIFEEDSNFLGVTIGNTVAYRKEIINLYNSPTIIVGKNADVRLETLSRTSVIGVVDGTPATIRILDGGVLRVSADNDKSGGPLVHLPGAGSSIQVEQNGTLDIRNFQDGRNTNTLLHLNGTVAMSDQISEVAFWDLDSNANNQFGNLYRHFPEVMNGSWTMENDRIISGTADADTSLSVSDDPGKDGQTFAQVFANRSTNNMKRLLISPVAIKSTLELDVPDRLDFEATELGHEEVLIPREIPDFHFRVTDTRGQGAKWEITAQAEGPLKTRRGEALSEDALIFTRGGEEFSLREAVLIQQGQTGETPETMISWAEDEGILLKINPLETVILSDVEYGTNIVWTIQDAP